MFISVVMAVYNGEKYLEEAIRSVLNQTYSQFELIIVNDGSVDRTREILDAITDRRVKIIHSDRNQGAAQSLNIGIEHAAGDWIAIHDADDISEPTRLQEQADYLQAHPDSVGVGSLIVGRIENEVVINPEVEYYNLLMDKKQIYRHRLFMCYLCHGTVTFSKKAFYEVGRYNPKYKISYDYDLWLRLFDISPIQKIPKILYHYRLRQDSLGKRNTSDTIAELMTISISYIHNKLRQKNKQPVISIVGTTKGCSFFKERVGKPFRRLNYVPVNKKSDFRKISLLSKHGKIHAAVVLNNRFVEAIDQHLLNRNSLWKKRLYRIWNYKF